MRCFLVRMSGIVAILCSSSSLLSDGGGGGGRRLRIVWSLLPLGIPFAFGIGVLGSLGLGVMGMELLGLLLAPRSRALLQL